MLTDAMLREAAAEAERFLLSIVPEEGEPHVFSKRFERKINKLIRRANHPIRYKVMRAAAAVVLVIATLFGTVMAVSPEARAAVVGWVKSAFCEFFEYSNEVPSTNNAPIDENNTTNEAAKYEYCLSVVPDGYREVNAIDKIDGKMYIYVNDSGHVLQFTYTCGAENSNLFADTENYECYSACVNELYADIYIALNETESNVIIWQDLQTGAIFEIFATADQAELIEIAETVTKLE